MKLFAFVASAIFALSTAYIAATASASAFYFANVLLHMGLGIVLAVVLGKAFARAWSSTGWFVRATGVLLLAGALTGTAIMVVGAYGPYRPLLTAHIALSLAGGVPLLLYLAVRPVTDAIGWRRTAFGATCTVLSLSLLGAVASATKAEDARRAQYRIVNPAMPPSSMNEEGAGPDSPFFPSSSNTNVRTIIPATFFMTSESCGRCHTQLFEEFQSSMHHFSSFNNQWYRKSIEYMQDVVGTQPSKWCAGCHDHAVFFNGRFDKPIRDQINTPEAQNGLGCTSCHSITKVNSTMGQGDFEIEYPPLHDLAASTNPILQFVHDRFTLIDPEPHKRIFMKPFHREQTPEFCSSCHKVHLDVPVNSYRWFRGFNDYDNWQASGVSGEGARSFYYPPKPQKCADCHMPRVPSTDPAAKNGLIKSHRFAAANTAVPFVNKDAVQLKAVQDFLKDGQVSIDVFGIVRAPDDKPAMAMQATASGSGQPRLQTTFAVGEEAMDFGATGGFIADPLPVVAPLDKVNATVRRGESVRLEVVVRTRKVGHFFPGGTVDAFDVWVELEARDETGRLIMHSGAIEDGGKGPVEPGAHFYRALLLDEHGNPINKRNAWAARSVAYVRLIPPGAADTVHYRLQVPPDAGNKITITAKLNYRKFMWWNTQFAFAGVRDPSQGKVSITPSHDDGRFVFTGDTSTVSGQIKAIPDIPTTMMATAQATLNVAGTSEKIDAPKPFLDKTVRERWNDYGIGLLLQGDLRGAEAAFLKVTEMDPGYADGWVNVARARIQVGNLAEAEAMLRKALTVDAQLAKTHFFLGTALKGQGRYDEALKHLTTASEQYPRDRVVLNQLGRVHFLNRQFAESVATLQRVIAIDPEDLQAHYNLMLAYQGLGDSAAAAREKTFYERFKADESSQEITGPYRQLHADDNNERQPIHEHRTLRARKQ